MKEIILDGNSLTLADVISVAREDARVSLGAEARIKVALAREYVDQKMREKAVIYGLTTGFGKFSDTLIDEKDCETLQRNLIMSHSCAMGQPLPEEIVRAVMLLRANALAKGHSGIRPETLETLINMINRGVHPVIPEKGSLGASGDLAPLAHMVLVMIGEGEAFYKGVKMPGKAAMDQAGIPLIVLSSKEGLALINGTQIMTAIASICLVDSENLLDSADVVAAMTVEALRGIPEAFDEKVHTLRGQKGQITCAKNLKKLLAGSSLVTKQGQLRVQDAYSLRCVPQIHGASRDAIDYARGVVEAELNAVTDNPLIFPEEDEVISGGNFHGQPIALAMDFLGIALSELADVSERRLERMVNPLLSDLPPFLIGNGGLNSGFMITQYVSASMVSENKVLAHPASVDSIPSSANQEDHVSMGTTAARKALMILDNAIKVLSIEAFAAAQALSLRGEVLLGAGTGAAYRLIRGEIPFVSSDIVMHEQMSKAEQLLKSGKIAHAAQLAVGKLDS